MKKLIIFLLCLAVLGGGGVFGYKRYMKQKDEKIVIDVVPVSKMYEPGYYINYSDNTIIGTVMDSNAQKISIDTEKLVKKVFVEEGQEVKKGDALFEYDMTVVELELTKKENSISLTEQDIKRANKEIEAIKKYKPSESAPKQPEINYEDFFEEYEEPEIEDVPSEPERRPVYTVDEVTPAFRPDDGNGSSKRPFIINCKPSARIDKLFIMQMVNEKRYVELCVYDSGSNYLYKWIIDPESTSLENISDWRADTGVSIDSSGAVTLDTGAAMPAKLSFARPRSEKFGGDETIPDGVTTADEDRVESKPQPSFPTYEEPKYDPNNHDYEYSRAEIQDLIVSKQDDIKKLELELKKAKRELETYKKRRKDGKELADRDGIVRKIGKASDDTEEEEKSEEDFYGEPDPLENYFAVVEGDGGTEVVFEVHEFEAEKFAVGTNISVSSFMNGAVSTGKIKKIDEVPLTYNSIDWGKNPNASTYMVHAKLDDPDEFSLYDGVSITREGEENNRRGNSDSVLIPMHYVRQEGGEYYIMRASTEGTLEKRYVITGAVLDYGLMRMVEIKGGISLSDKICFPYGKEVKEGVKTRDTDEVLYPEAMMGGMR